MLPISSRPKTVFRWALPRSRSRLGQTGKIVRPRQAFTRSSTYIVMLALRPNRAGKKASRSSEGVNSIGSGEDGLLLGLLAAIDTAARPRGLFQRNTAHRSFRFLLDFLFARGAPAPMRNREALFHRRLEPFVVFGFLRVRVTKRKRPSMERLLDLSKGLRHNGSHPRLRNEGLALFARPVAPRQHHRAFADVLGP